MVWVAVAAVSLNLAGCTDNPGSWPQDKVEAKVSESLGLAEINLGPGAEPGVLSGTGKTSEW